VDNTGEERRDMTDPSAPRQHVHHYYGRTTMDLDHFHVFDGTTGLDYEIGQGHVHRFGNETSRAHSHTHRMHGNTSQQIMTFWGHVHQIAGMTSFDDGHTHRFDVYSGTPTRPRSRRPRLMSSHRTLPRGEGSEIRQQSASPRRRLFRKVSSSSRQQ